MPREPFTSNTSPGSISSPASAAASAAAAAGPDDRPVHAVADAARDLVRPGDIVLVKASRGVRLEAVTRALTGAQDEART